jgi:hypothetical protein
VSEAPPPPVPPDLDVSALPGFMLNIHKLLASRLWGMSTGDEFKAAVALWAASWQQVPAGSLRNDERELQSHSRSGSRWKKVKAVAMHGFILCSDGLYYHPVVCADAIRANKARQQRRDAIAKRYDKDPKPDRATAVATAVGHPKHDPEPGRTTSNDTKRDESKKESPPSAADPVKEAFDAYNALAERIGLPVARKCEADRRGKIRRRLDEWNGLLGWAEALERLAASPHCCGSNDRGWRADLDFLLEPRSFTRLMEGRYDARKPAAKAPDALPLTGDGQRRARIRSYQRDGEWLSQWGPPPQPAELLEERVA